MKTLKSYIEPIQSIYDKPIINEHLKTLDIKVVVKRLNAKFAMGKDGDIKMQGLSNYGDKHPTIQLIAPEQLNNFIDELRIELDLMMWCLTSHWVEGGLFIFQIEPIRANQCNDYVYKDCGGILYHPTSKMAANRILKSGLRHKGKSYESGDYRSFPARTYFIVGTDSDNIKWAIDEVRGSFGVGAYKLDTILRIDLTKYGKGLEFYHDTLYEIPNTVFAYSNIPGVLIEMINYNEI